MELKLAVESSTVRHYGGGAVSNFMTVLCNAVATTDSKHLVSALGVEQSLNS